jgi:hypothetical protein
MPGIMSEGSGKGDSSTFLITLNMVVPAPMPKPRVSIARKENPGFARMPRIPYRKSCHRDCMVVRRPRLWNVPRLFQRAG